MYLHLAALLAAIRNHPYALPGYLLIWGAVFLALVARWGL